MNYDIEYLNDLIINGVEENLHLEYKGAGSLQKADGKKAEISKDVSAFANSDGGTIIYGILEFQENTNHLPEKIDPIKREDISKEWLEQVINSNIQSKVPNIEIIPISIEETKVVYVVNIPKGETAHQAKDKRYYKRYNFESVAMEDYEIKDILNRNIKPIVNMKFEIEKLTYFERLTETQKHLRNFEINKPKILTRYLLKIAIQNDGKVFANYINYFVYLPLDIVNQNKYEINTKLEMDGIQRFVYSGENTIRDIIDVDNTILGNVNKYGPSRYKPLLPEVNSVADNLILNSKPNLDDREILWKLFADNSTPNIGKIKLSDIQIINIDRTK